ncbi:hypothetical protein ACFSSA_13295 [Luteolibacter algae]|uniref:DUF3552 domain-containing protein n=1 Tax=Luteolibacter algae TaxID=454151 RepID=A0ABW5D9R0_9BACT
MANILGIFTAVVLAVAAFVASKNKARFEEEISNRDAESESLVKSQARLKSAQETLKTLPEERAEADAQFAAKQEAEVEMKKANEETQQQIAEKTQEIAANKKKLDVNREKTAKVGDILGLSEKMKNLRVELEELDQSIAGREATLSNLTARNTSAQAEVKRWQNEFDLMGKGQSLATLQTRIRNIYPTWGFVTLAGGNNAGVINNSTLDVVRNGEVIAKLLVTAVESSSASASVIPDSVKDNATLMVGDQVVPTSGSSKADKKSASN